MGTIEGVFTEKGAKASPAIFQAVKYNGMVYVSGNIGMDAATWTLVDGTVKDRTVEDRHAFGHDEVQLSIESLRRLLKVRSTRPDIRTGTDSGAPVRSKLDQHLPCARRSWQQSEGTSSGCIFLTSMDNFAIMNEAYDEIIAGDPNRYASLSCLDMFGYNC